jgi:DUF4097 and DUF4098 domain-containing protein YvlB
MVERIYSMRQQLFLTLLISVVAVTAGCDGGVNGDVTATASGASTVNGSILVPANLHSGKLDTVNGSIHIDDTASVTTASTVNGSIDLGAHASADSLSTVNGGLTVDDGARVTHGLDTVNGSMQLKNGADVGGHVRNVNGHIVLTGAHVAGGLRTAAGDIDVVSGSHVEGGILVEQSSGLFNLNFNPRKPRIVIGPGAVVQGDLRFERPVQLYVSDRATVGPISGATPIRFSGDNPPG